MCSLYEGIMQGLNGALAYTRNEPLENVKVHKMEILEIPEYTPSAIKQIRLSTNMTQSVFASCIGVTKKAVESWEGGRSRPNGTARRLLSLFEVDPQFADKTKIIKR